MNSALEDIMTKTPTPLTDALLALWQRPDSHRRHRFALWALWYAERTLGVGVMS